MSRIHDILKKAERDGGMHRTRAIDADGASAAAAVAEPPAMPIAPLPVRRAGASAEAVAASAAPPRSSAGPIDARLVAAHAPQSFAAEQYRSLRTRVNNAENGRALRAVLITSPNKGDGKSLTAANLALTMAQEFQQRVLLVDADLRRPSIHRLFGITDTPGLSDILMGGATIDDALVAVPEHGLTILPSGGVPMHPAELLGSAPMRRMLDTLRTRFDRILIDMPPVAPLADVAIASAMADGILMIVRAGVTPRPAIERALSGLDMSKVLGLVLNDAGDTAAGYGYSYGRDGYTAG
jgi:capsular exopolysaccharide synthesis family protein